MVPTVDFRLNWLLRCSMATVGAVREPDRRWLLKDFEILSDIAGEALEIASLPFGKDDVEGQSRLSGPAQARQHDHPVPRQADFLQVEVVFAGTAHHNVPVRREG